MMIRKVRVMKYANKIPSRAVVYPKDVENITGRKDSAARKYLLRIKKAFAKKDDQFVTIQEFCQYSGIDENIVREYIKG
jgi:hypothetical protein